MRLRCWQPTTETASVLSRCVLLDGKHIMMSVALRCVAPGGDRCDGGHVAQRNQHQRTGRGCRQQAHGAVQCPPLAGLSQILCYADSVGARLFVKQQQLLSSVWLIVLRNTFDC